MKTKYFWIIILVLIIQCKNRKATGNLHSEKGLYYFATKDSTYIGVEDENGKIVIPAEFSAIAKYDFKNPITNKVIEFWGNRENRTSREKYDRTSPVQFCGETYDHNGKFLYKVLCYDNGSDYFSEGLRRIIIDKKIGFADKDGKIIIPANYDWADPFQKGYTQVIVGKVKKNHFDGEHWTVVCEDDCVTFFIDKTGKKVIPKK